MLVRGAAHTNEFAATYDSDQLTEIKVFRNVCRAEIGELYAHVAVEQNVFRLQIPMKYPFTVNPLDGVDDLRGVVSCTG